MSADTVTFTGPLDAWHSPSHGNMAFLPITGPAAEAIKGHELMRRLELGRRRGFGSVKVQVELGGSRWATSVFPQKDGSWFLPVKSAITRAEDLAEGDVVTVELGLL